VALMLLMFLGPLVHRGAAGRILYSALGTVVLLGGIFATSSNRRNLWLSILLMLPALVVQWFSTIFIPVRPRLFLEPAFYHIPFFLFMMYLLARYVFEPGRVHTDRLAGAACIYLLIGTLWGYFFFLAERMSPGAFSFASGAIESNLHMKLELSYFSYVTLTTLGYGEITPVSPYARSLAMSECVLGVLYVGILVARLAGTMDEETPEEQRQM
jgi:voltage-gated potassium channel